ncbi:MAG: hypothetical protein ABI769_02990 [Pseudomonadota bacterium]
MMKLKPLPLAGVVVGLCAAGAAFAGTRSTLQVIVSPSGMYAMGDVGAAYNSTSNYNEYIGCASNASPGYSWGICYATDSEGVSRYCTTDSADLLASMRSVDANTRLTFTWDGNGSCTTVSAGQYSFTDPKR